jgi:DNA topoisomerase-3
MVQVVVAEKPSVARDIAKVLGANQRADGYLYGGDWVVTWAIGHLVALPQPHEIDASWKAWRWDALPMLPRRWPLTVMEQTASQFQVVRKLINGRDVEAVVCATDAGREGELIFRFIYEAAQCTRRTRRLWISSLTPDAIRNGFNQLEDGSARNRLADAARGRAQADWLVGMNLSRAYSLGQPELFTVGRVQTPTLAMLVEREKAIRAFVPEDYLEVEARFAAPAGSYKGTWFSLVPEGQPLAQRKRLPPDGQRARALVDAVKQTGRGSVESIREETRRMAPPQLYDLTELQRHANRLFGFSAQRTLDVAQALYEKHKLISYPRTDSRHLSSDVARTLPNVVAAIRAPYEADLAPGTGTQPLGRRHVDDAEVSDHHAIIPTAVDPSTVHLSADEERIHDLIRRRLLQAWHPDHIWAVTTLVTAVDTAAGTERFHSSGTAVKQPGWKVLDVQSQKTRRTKGPAPRDDDGEEAPEDQDLPSGLADGTPVKVDDATVQQKKTRPPKRHTEATILSAMEGAGKLLDDKELSRAMKDRGLGTPATRAAILEGLIKREYVTRDGKALVATDKGMALVDTVHTDVKSPAMTGEWEAQLREVERGSLGYAQFIERVEQYVRDVVGKVRSQPAVPRPGAPTGLSRPPSHSGAGAAVAEQKGAASTSSSSSARVAPQGGPISTRTVDLRTRDMKDLLTRVFGHPGFRAHQEDVCRSAVAGNNVLLVMPTGAGKSLCYQLPGLCRGGTTLVISPLIALMEDQVTRLQQLGLAAERIHSGRDRAASREACRAYLDGALDFLFIAPERLAVQGFPEMLARRKPVLIAVDEAHCISQWGHDFRPEYRMLQQRLPLLMPAPIMALTATATPRVQQDIVEQLGFLGVRRFIHGFRRPNLALEVVEVPKPERWDVAAALLKEPENRPAILYAPSRSDAEELAASLSALFPTQAYHAGLNAKRRDETQTAFLSGKLDAVVATIAFGMGVDKADIRTVVHLALPSSVEGYYQEVGRAGRDGKPSRAVLLHSFADRRMHEFFREKAYPPVSVLARLLEKVPADGILREDLRARADLGDEVFDAALEKLWIHGGVVVDVKDRVTVGERPWERSYKGQLEHRIAQEEAMARFTSTHGCRMVHLVRHFGDSEDSGKDCGVCDSCDPDGCEVQEFAAPSGPEQNLMRAILSTVSARGLVATGTLFRDLTGVAGGDRNIFEQVVSALVRAGLVRSEEASFQKDGKSISYQRLLPTEQGEEAERSTLEAVVIPRMRHRTSTGSRKGKARPAREKSAPLSSADSSLFQALREWRKAQAAKRGVPAFRIAADAVLEELARRKPTNADELEQVKGVGPAFLKKHGDALLRVLHGTGGRGTSAGRAGSARRGFKGGVASTSTSARR